MLVASILTTIPTPASASTSDIDTVGLRNVCIDIIITTDSQSNIIMVTEDKEKASLFAEYFSSVFTHEKKEKFEELKLSCHIDNMPSLEITEENVLTKIKCHKNRQISWTGSIALWSSV